MKRAIDFVGATVLVVLLLPLLLAIAIGVRLTSPGPVLFRQTRVGQHGRNFKMLKFRTFPADHVDSRVVERHEDGGFALPAEECPSAFGRLLRRTSLDELPQLLNVLRGEMSLVGPRPEKPYFAAPLCDEIPGYGARHRVPVGITGLAQVNGLWGAGNIEERVRYDNDYIDQWSLGLDLKILLKTIPEVLVKARVR